ncbi:insulinase family protein [Altererythrobacter sp.]|nr:insulinase family protein [Altererythrobacter sp.]
MLKHILFASAATLLLTHTPVYSQSTAETATVWAYEEGDLQAEDGYVFGQLENGMRYVIRQNSKPEGTALVRMEIAGGRLAEGDNERGFAHFIEHMAFNGTTGVPEGEMIKLLERKGLEFGADTNAETGFGHTQYKLNLPNNTEDLLDTALMLMRETAGELLLDTGAVERERGIMLAERRTRTTYQLLNSADQIDFFLPGSMLSNRFPVADRSDLGTATSDQLRAFYERNYVPANTTLVVIGDFDAGAVEAKIKERFSDWQAGEPAGVLAAGPVNFDHKGATSIYLNDALSTQISAARYGPLDDAPDSKAKRAKAMLRSIGYGIVNRRLQLLTQSDEPPFRGASFGSSDLFDDARETTLAMAAIDGKWEQGLTAAVTELRRALQYGFADTEIAEQIANRRQALQNAVASAATRSNSAFVGRAIGLVRNERVPTAPDTDLALFEEVAASLSPESILAAIKADVPAMDEALLRYQGRTAPEGGEQAIRSVWEAAYAAPVSPPAAQAEVEFAYTDFGAPGTVTSDTVDEAMGIRQIVFGNGVMLNLKKTALEEDRIRVSYVVDGGTHLATEDNPEAVELLGILTLGGLGKHDLTDIQKLLAGRTASFSIGAGADSFGGAMLTTPRDLELQMQLIAAFLTDPGYRQQAITRYRNSLDDYYARLYATPGSAVGADIGGILSDQNPRFSLSKKETLEALDFDVLRSAITDSLENGALEIALVGDLDEQAAIDVVAKTLGALPRRRSAFEDPEGARTRTFTADRSQRIVRHTGEADQALVRYDWPTTDATDPVAGLGLDLLKAIVDLKITAVLREELGKTYTPSIANRESRYYDGYGTFTIAAVVAPEETDNTRAAIDSAITELRATPVDADLLQRARQPLLENLDNALKTNAGWLRYTRRAQSEPDRIERLLAAKDRLNGLTPEYLQELAQTYLTADGAVRTIALPAETDETE